MNLGNKDVDGILKYADPVIAAILDKSISGRDISAREALVLFDAKGIDFQLVGKVADYLRMKKVGDIVTYVVNRNINFTNVCIKQCGFCAFSRDFREEEGYTLPIEEITRRAKEAHTYGATEVCVQAGLPPDMDADLYENICREIKIEVPDIHIHGFSPEEILYGATRSNISTKEYLSRLRDAGVDTIPGTAAEILNQKLRDKISPGRITVKEWTDVIKTAHKMGIRSTSTMMFGHLETNEHRVNHLETIREIQKETGGFTEFVPLNFIYSEAPMYKHQLHEGIKKGANSNDALLVHAISRIMLNNVIDNIQMSWVKEGPRFSQVLLNWGANDFGGTLINESISTAAGSGYGQLLKPKEIRHLIRGVGRTPAERDTTYRKIKKFDTEPTESDALDGVKDEKKFGSYFDLIKIKKYQYQNPREN